MKEIILCSALALMLCYHIFLLHDINAKCGVNSHSAVIFTLIIYVDIVPLIVFTGGADAITDSYTKIIEVIKNCSLTDFFVAEMAVFLFTSIYELTYRSKNNLLSVEVNRFDKGRMNDCLHFFAWFTFIVGGASFLLYIRAFGGISVLLSYAEYFRTFRTNNSEIIGSAALRLIVPARLILVTPILFFSYMKSVEFKSKYKAPLYGICFIISIFLAGVFLLFNAGKTNLVIMMICFGMPILSRKVRHPWALSLTAGFLMIPLVGAIDSIFTYITYGQWYGFSTNIGAYIGQFCYVFANLINLDKMIELHGFRWGKDFITGPLSIVPGINFPASYEVSSEAIFGKSWQMIAGVPDDIITFGYLQLGFIGVLFVGWLLGIVSGKLDRLIRQMNYGTFGVLITTIIMSMYSYLINADWSVLVKSQFQLTICVICILYSFNTQDGNRKRVRFVFGRR